MNEPIIIAEAGVNHNGKINLAKKLIDLASNAKADYVKFQLYKTDDIVTEQAQLAGYQKKNMSTSISQNEMLKKYELNIVAVKELINYSKKKKIKFLCTPFDVESAKLLIKCGIKEFKISSPDIDNFPLLSTVCKYATRIFLSSGMSTLKDISNALNFLKKKKFKKKNIFILHCTSDYPAKKKELNLLAIKLIKKKFDVNTGYSDHTIGNLASISAVVMGSKVIEKHITLNKKYKGPDHLLSMTEIEFTKFTKLLKDIPIILGSEIKKITNGEKKNYKSIKRSVFLNKDIKKGEKFTINHFICKRPSYKMSSINWSKFLYKKSSKEIKKGTLLKI